MTRLAPPGPGDIEAAAKRLVGIAVETPLICSPELDEAAGGRILLKAENLQYTGSFKIRGAYNLMCRLEPERAAAGVVAWSSGNHAQGVAAAGRLLGIKTTIVMPEDAPAVKLDRTRRLGGRPVLYDRYREDRETIARGIADETGAVPVPSYDHPDIVAGQGTVGLEIVRQAAAMGVRADRVVVPCGGGGLIAGTATAVRAAWPDVAVYPVEPEDFDDTARSLHAGTRLTNPPESRSICDALQAGTPGRLTFDINRRLLAEGLVVSDEEVTAALRFAFRNLKLVLEPGGAVALAALLAGRLPPVDGITVAVLSGGNVDPLLFARIQQA